MASDGAQFSELIAATTTSAVHLEMRHAYTPDDPSTRWPVRSTSMPASRSAGCPAGEPRTCACRAMTSGYSMTGSSGSPTSPATARSPATRCPRTRPWPGSARRRSRPGGNGPPTTASTGPPPSRTGIPQAVVVPTSPSSSAQWARQELALLTIVDELAGRGSAIRARWRSRAARWRARAPAGW
jgi:hypothetical protein